MRDGISAMLKKEPDFSIMDSLGEKDFGVGEIRESKPNIVLLDLGLTKVNSLEFVKALKEEIKDVKVIVMDLVPIQEDILHFVEAGVSGFILKDATVAEFTKTIRLVSAGEKVLPKTLTGSLFSQIMDYGVKELSTTKLIQAVRMTKREREIVELIAQGLSNKEIAYKLNLSIYTIKSHVHNILEKMALNSRVQIAIHARTGEDTSSEK